MVRSWSFGLLFLALALGGCRTYGSHGNVEEMHEALTVSVEELAEALPRAEADFDVLRRVAAVRPELEPLVMNYRDALEMHAALVLEQEEKLEELGSSSDYRDLHRAFGASLSERRMIALKYRSMIENAVQTVDTTSAPASELKSRSFYVIRPPYYVSVVNKRERSLPRLVLEVEGMPDEAPPLPEAADQTDGDHGEADYGGSSH